MQSTVNHIFLFYQIEVTKQQDISNHVQKNKDYKHKLTSPAILLLSFFSSQISAVLVELIYLSIHSWQCLEDFHQARILNNLKWSSLIKIMSTFNNLQSL